MAIPWITMLAAAVLSQAPADSGASATEAAVRAANAAERAAVAAERAAEAARATAERLVPGTAASPTAAATGAPSAWTATAGIGLISLTGNAESLSFNGTVSAARKSEHWIFGGKATGAYGQTRPADGGDPQIVALAAGLQLRGDRRVTKVASVYLLAGADTDHVKSIEFRGLGEAGAAIQWLDEKEGNFSKLLLRTDFALRYANERRFQYYPFHVHQPGVYLVAPKIGVAFRYGLHKDVFFAEDAEVLVSVAGTTSGRTLAQSVTKISARMTESTSLAVALRVDHDSAPAVGKKPTDTALLIGIEVAL